MTPPVPPRQIADVLATNLETVFDGLCEHRYGGPLSLERVDPPDDAPATAHFRLHRADLPDLSVDFEIRHVGGNVYDVLGIIDNGPSRTFTYSLPDPAPPVVPRAPRLAREVASFLLDALERRVGSNLLRSEVRDRRTPSPPNRSTSRSPSPSRP
jgi:hypothetical protein